MLDTLITIAEAAGQKIMAVKNRSEAFDVHKKKDNSPVTEADLAASELICCELLNAYPDIPVLSEENVDDTAEETRLSWDKYWLVDPLDGTKEFIRGRDEFTVNIALIEDGEVMVGVVHSPALGVSWAGDIVAGKAIRRDQNEEISIFGTMPQSPLRILVSYSHGNAQQDAFLAALKETTPIEATAMGSSLKLCKIAEGSGDLHVRFGPTCEWDTAAAQAVLEAAGGKVMDFSYKPLSYNKTSGLLNPNFIAVGDTSIDWQKSLPL